MVGVNVVPQGIVHAINIVKIQDSDGEKKVKINENATKMDVQLIPQRSDWYKEKEMEIVRA